MVTTAQAVAAGVSRVDLSRLVADGALEPAPGAVRVYRLTGSPPDPDLDGLRAAWLQLDGGRPGSERAKATDAVARGRSAALIHRLGDLSVGVYEFYVFSRRQLRRRDVRVLVRPDLPAGDWVMVEGLPVTTVLRTVTDLLGESEDASAVGRVCQDALRAELLDVGALARAVAPFAAAYGADTGRALAEVLLQKPRVRGGEV
jgi:hypothetical protein